MVISRSELAELSQIERDELSQMLCDLGARRVVVGDPRRKRLVLTTLSVCVIGLALWIVALGLTLPPSQTTRQWRLAWIGFDVAELIGFAVTGWAGRNSRQLVIPAALITGTLLLCDAWFDVVLSWNSGGRWWSLGSAVLIEVPLALFLWFIGRRLAMAGVTVARARIGIHEPPPPLYRLTLFDPVGGSGTLLLPIDPFEQARQHREARVRPARPRRRSTPGSGSGGTGSATPGRASSNR